MNNETRTIVVPANATVTIHANTTGETEAKQSTPLISDRKANGLTPLYRVRYTAKSSGKTAVYGVFWEGMKNGVHRVGLRRMLNDGSRMSKRTRHNRGFFVDAAETERVS